MKVRLLLWEGWDDSVICFVPQELSNEQVVGKIGYSKELALDANIVIFFLFIERVTLPCFTCKWTVTALETVVSENS